MKKEAPLKCKGLRKRPPMKKEAPLRPKESRRKTSDEKRGTRKHKGLERLPAESATRENATDPIQHRTKKVNKTLAMEPHKGDA
jgi:hypothetical protein